MPKQGLLIKAGAEQLKGLAKLVEAKKWGKPRRVNLESACFLSGRWRL